MHRMQCKEERCDGSGYIAAGEHLYKAIDHEGEQDVEQQAIEMIDPWLEAIASILEGIGDDGERMIVAHDRTVCAEYTLYTFRRIVFDERIGEHIAKVIPVGELIAEGTGIYYIGDERYTCHNEWHGITLHKAFLWRGCNGYSRPLLGLAGRRSWLCR